MNFKIWHKLAVLLIATTSLTIIIGIGLSQLSFKRGFLEYLQHQENRRLEILANNLLMAYEENGSWEFIRNNKRLWGFYLRPRPSDGRRFREPSYPSLRERNQEEYFPDYRMKGHRPLNRRDGGRHLLQMALLDENKKIIVGNPSFKVETRYFPLTINGNSIAYLQSEKKILIIDRLDKMFESRQNQAFLINTLVSLVISLIVALLASIYLRKRMSGLTRIAHQLTSGEYGQRVEIKQQDELGQLSMDFNILAETLQKNQQSQRQWIADISHELRTPVAILKGELEALDDGIRPLNKAAIHSLQQEIERLGKLVEDLYQLSISDMGALKYEKSDFVIYDLLKELHGHFQARYTKQAINLSIEDFEPKTLEFYGDQQRLFQLFSNLLENSLHYTNSGGEVRIKMSKNEYELIITIEDSAPGIDEEKLPHIFKRLFRVESSRNRSKGGAGLGLAISRQIVLAHQGKISAHPSELGGVTINCVFPILH